MGRASTAGSLQLRHELVEKYPDHCFHAVAAVRRLRHYRYKSAIREPRLKRINGWFRDEKDGKLGFCLKVNATAVMEPIHRKSGFGYRSVNNPSCFVTICKNHYYTPV